MTMTEVVSAAFTFRQAWMKVSSKQGSEPCLFGHSDALLLPLLIEIKRATQVVTADASLAAALSEALAMTPLGSKVSVAAKEEQRSIRTLVLVDFKSLGALQLEGRDPVVAYALPAIMKTTNVGAKDGCFIPFAFQAAALFNSRLAWCCTESQVEAVLGDIARLKTLISTDWLDPLWLYEQIQGLKYRSNGAVPLDEHNDLVNRVAELEKEIESLELSGILKHELLVTDAARRRKFLK